MMAIWNTPLVISVLGLAFRGATLSLLHCLSIYPKKSIIFLSCIPT
ncbi:hypothetical protein [Sutcliffiella sp. FSL R7-0096]